jgi:hypothetical protein
MKHTYNHVYFLNMILRKLGLIGFKRVTVTATDLNNFYNRHGPDEQE